MLLVISHGICFNLLGVKSGLKASATCMCSNAPNRAVKSHIAEWVLSAQYGPHDLLLGNGLAEQY